VGKAAGGAYTPTFQFQLYGIVASIVFSLMARRVLLLLPLLVGVVARLPLQLDGTGVLPWYVDIMGCSMIFLVVVFVITISLLHHLLLCVL
jgi:hypothetical protein